MRRPLPLLLALALTLAAALALAAALRPAPGPRAYAPQGQGDLYLALGDSLAWGFNLDNPGAESYPALIHADLARRESIALANLSVPGATSGSLLEGQLPRALELIRAERRAGRQVSPITIDIGGNDLRNVERAGPAERAAAVERARANIARALDALREAAGPGSDIAIMTYYNPYGGDAAQEGSDAYWIERLNAAIREEAGRRAVAVADVYPAFAGGRFYTHTFILLGDIHANAQGHALIARVFLDALAYR
jgi:lysophospholipase L1-like esterase